MIRRIFALAAPLRRKRMALFQQMFAPGCGTRILDVGGYPATWASVRGPSVVMVNLEAEDWSDGRLSKVQGDGRALAYPDNSFDVAFSNSVVEHVGTWEDQHAFAREIRRVAPAYYVQTPYRHFPVEVHTLTPFVQYLPPKWQKRLFRWVTLWGWLARPTPDYLEGFVDHLKLLDERQFRELFPDATIHRERVFGLTKSLIACRSPYSTLK